MFNESFAYMQLTPSILYPHFRLLSSFSFSFSFPVTLAHFLLLQLVKSLFYYPHSLILHPCLHGDGTERKREIEREECNIEIEKVCLKVMKCEYGRFRTTVESIQSC